MIEKVGYEHDFMQLYIKCCQLNFVANVAIDINLFVYGANVFVDSKVRRHTFWLCK